jgi:hypothetical protein
MIVRAQTRQFDHADPRIHHQAQDTQRERAIRCF